MNNKYFKCNCGCGGIEINVIEELENNVYIEFLKRTHRTIRFRERLKMFWSLLRRGYYYDDDIILDKDTAISIARELLRVAQPGGVLNPMNIPFFDSYGNEWVKKEE